MDLDSWTPRDKARRLAVAIAVQASVFVLVVLWMALAWPWYLVIAGVALTYALVYLPAFWLLQQFWRR